MCNLSFSQLQKMLSNVDLSTFPEINVAVLRNITIEPIEIYLRYYAYVKGLNCKVNFGEYDNIFQEAISPESSIITKETNYVLIFMHIENLSPCLTKKYTSSTKDDITNEKLRIKDYISSVLSGIRKQTDAFVLWHSFEPPLFPALGIMDAQMENGQMQDINDLNGFLRKNLKEYGNAYLIDLGLCLARLGANAFYDKRYWYIAKSIYSRKAMSYIALENYKFINALTGKNKKCLVLDCDNVLWGGVVGEDGLSGIKLGNTYPGALYSELQNEIINMYKRGIIIAVCSKNNEEDVWNVFRNHPDMALKEEHIAAYQINWNDKSTNLRLIASDLNIGLDSIVFVDDNEFEVEWVRRSLPEVEVVHLTKDKLINISEILASDCFFDSLSFSKEDKNRGAMYKAEAERKKHISAFDDMKSYFESLEMVVVINTADHFYIPRIAQLTQKTNQFNLTTKRYSETDISGFIEGNNAEVIYVTLKDRFGDMGIVGVSILTFADSISTIDTFLLSCRALGRELETVFLNSCLFFSKSKGMNIVLGKYISTRKNNQVKNFYLNEGFKIIEDSKTNYVSQFDLADFIFKAPGFYKNIFSNFLEYADERKNCTDN